MVHMYLGTIERLSIIILSISSGIGERLFYVVPASISTYVSIYQYVCFYLPIRMYVSISTYVSIYLYLRIYL